MNQTPPPAGQDPQYPPPGQIPPQGGYPPVGGYPPPGYGYPPQGQYPPQPVAYGYPYYQPPRRRKTGLIVGLLIGALVLVALVVILAVPSVRESIFGGGSPLYGVWLQDTDGQNVRLEFRRDNTFSISVDDEQVSGTFEFRDADTIYTKTGGDLLDEVEINFRVDGNTLTLDVDGYEEVLTRAP